MSGTEVIAIIGVVAASTQIAKQAIALCRKFSNLRKPEEIIPFCNEFISLCGAIMELNISADARSDLRGFKSDLEQSA